MEVRFITNMDSEGLMVLERLCKPPIKQMHQVMAKKAAELVRLSYPHRFREPMKGNIYQGIKRALYGDSIEPGQLTGATEEGITGIVENLGYDYTVANVVLSGRWPRRETNFNEHISLSLISSLSNDDNFSADFSGKDVGDKFGGLGAFVSLTASGGLKIKWDKELLENSELEDWDVPAQRLENKRYGEKVGWSNDFMYLTWKHIDALMDTAEDMVDNLLESNKQTSRPSRWAPATPRGKRTITPSTPSVSKEEVVDAFRALIDNVTENIVEETADITRLFVHTYGADLVKQAQAEIMEMIRSKLNQ